MKKLFILSILAFAFLFKLHAQENHLIVFSEDLLPFYAYVNGVKQNTEPMTNVKVTGLDQQAYQLIVMHEDETIPKLEKKLYFDPMGMANTIKITQTKKGYKLRFFGQVPLAQSPKEYTEIVYHTEPFVVTEEPEPEPVNEKVTMKTDVNMGTNIQMNTEVITKEETPNRTTETTTESVNMGVNIGGFNMGVDVNVTETTETSHFEESVVIEVPPTADTPDAEMDIEYVVEEAPCDISSSAFESAKNSISSKTFSDAKMTIAKQVTRGNCLWASQIAEITALFDYESDRLDYAKFAFEYCSNPGSYYKVNDAFEFESSIEELDEFMNK